MYIIDTTTNTECCWHLLLRYIHYAHTYSQCRNTRGKSRQHGLWVPTVIRMAEVTERVFSPLNRKTAFCVSLIFSSFSRCVGKERSSLCQATRLKSKVNLDSHVCVLAKDNMRDRKGPDPCSYLHGSKNISPQKVGSPYINLQLVKNIKDQGSKCHNQFFFWHICAIVHYSCS